MGPRAVERLELLRSVASEGGVELSFDGGRFSLARGGAVLASLDASHGELELVGVVKVENRWMDFLELDYWLGPETELEPGLSLVQQLLFVGVRLELRDVDAKASKKMGVEARRVSVSAPRPFAWPAHLPALALTEFPGHRFPWPDPMSTAGTVAPSEGLPYLLDLPPLLDDVPLATAVDPTDQADDPTDQAADAAYERPSAERRKAEAASTAVARRADAAGLQLRPCPWPIATWEVGRAGAPVGLIYLDVSLPFTRIWLRAATDERLHLVGRRLRPSWNARGWLRSSLEDLPDFAAFFAEPLTRAIYELRPWPDASALAGKTLREIADGTLDIDVEAPGKLHRRRGDRLP